jgi:outer membrane protein TolC
MRAHAGYREARSMFLPQMVVGSGLAKTFGFPLSIEGAAPSVFQVSYQSFLYNPAQRDFIKSAKEAWVAATAATDDQRDATLLEAALTYIQLDTLTTRARILRQQQEAANRLVTVVEDRVHAGVESAMEATRARLSAAQVHMRLTDAEGTADVLRERLAQLTGLTANSIETVPESIPEVPDLSEQQNLVPAVLATSPVVKAADQQALAKELRARGEHKALYPAVDAVAQYGLFTRYNNFDLYFNHFQRNNATIGVAIRFAFLNFPQRAQAELADAEAVKAKRQSWVTKEQVSTDTIRLSRSARQLAAAEQVAKLDYQLAQAQADALQTRIHAAAPGAPTVPGQAPAPPPGPQDLQAARILADDKYSTYLDTTLELQKARLQLLRATGKLEGWAVPHP